jgi:TPP-dependent pyruvate/acetoin dehydrogenase alpha subunit
MPMITGDGEMVQQSHPNRAVDVSTQTASRSEGSRLLALYRQMLVIRVAEERISELFRSGEIPGFIHLSIGQEAVPVGVMSALDPKDTIASTHRGHGHGIAKGLSLTGFFAELFGLDHGLCRGRGGSMHVADLGMGMLGANGIVGAGLSIAIGSALAHKSLGRKAAAVAFFGDGALGEGILHECFNLAALWKLPIMFVCENNGWSEFSPTSQQIAFRLRDLASAFNIQYSNVDGNDVVSVADVASALVAAVRAGEGPAVLECLTARVRGHYEGDPQKYRSVEEIGRLKHNDPLRVARTRLTAASAEEVARIDAEVRAEVDTAIRVARGSPQADFAAALADVYTKTEAGS